MRRTVCFECVAACGLLQLLLTYVIVYLVMAPSSEVVHTESRLLLSLNEPTGPKFDANTSEERISTTNEDFLSITSDQGLMDKYRKHKSHVFVSTGNDWHFLSDSRQVCLATQTSIDRVHWLLSTLETWSGPISVSIFTPDLEYDISRRYIHFLRSCYPRVARQVAFHFVYPNQHPIRESDDLAQLVAGQPASCDRDPKEFLQFLLSVRNDAYLSWRNPLEYPQNLMRNVAKNACQTNFTFVPDVDMIPNPGLDLSLDQFFQMPGNTCGKCAYVVPVYEISDKSERFPNNKTELVEYIKKKQARQFHEAIYKLNQKSSNLTQWEKQPQGSELKVAYSVSKYLFKYEPLYVARADSPPFDERFIGFGMTRNTQVYEMYVAGYTFHVLNNAYASHWGFQSLKNRPDWRAKQQEQNNARFDDFAREVSARYGRDPYQMLSKLKKMNLKNLKVSYAKSPKVTS